MENRNRVDVTISIRSFKNGEPFLTEYEFSEMVSDEAAEGLNRTFRAYEDMQEEPDGHSDIFTEKEDLAAEGYDENFADSRTVNELARRVEVQGECLQELYEMGEEHGDHIEAISDDLRRARRMGKVILAAQVLLAVGFFLLHRRVEHGRKDLSGKAV